MIVLYTLLVAILLPAIIWTIISNIYIFRNGWNWKKICETKIPFAKFIYIWAKIWLYVSAVGGWIWFSYMIAYVIFM